MTGSAERADRDRWVLALSLSGGLVLLVVVAAFAVRYGSTPISLSALGRVLIGHRSDLAPADIVVDQIVWQIRLPRVLLAMVVGAALSTAGTVIQALVRNPLADPFLLGISSGASVGATSVLLFGAFSAWGLWSLTVGSVAGALVALLLVFALSTDRGQLTPLRLVLSGVALAAMFQAITSFLIFQGDPRATQTVVYWLLGSFGRATWSQLWLPSVALLVAIGYLQRQARALNALAIGPQLAISLGIEVHRLRRSLFVVTSLITGVAVAVSGIVGFVGLVVPHIVRFAVGSDHRRTLPVGAIWGAAFLVGGDLIARTLVSPQEMPIGVVTAFIGGPVFLYLLRRGRYGGGDVT